MTRAAVSIIYALFMKRFDGKQALWRQFDLFTVGLAG
jgi:hypothetical protein